MLNWLLRLTTALGRAMGGKISSHVRRQQLSNPAVAAMPQRRDAKLFYVVMVCAGLCGGVSLAPFFAAFLDLGWSMGTVGLILSALGCLTGFAVARIYRERYKRAVNGWCWLSLFPIPYLGGAGLFLLVMGIVMALIAVLIWTIILAILPILLLIFLLNRR